MTSEAKRVRIVQNVGINFGRNTTEKAALEILISNPGKTAEEMDIEIESTAF